LPQVFQTRNIETPQPNIRKPYTQFFKQLTGPNISPYRHGFSDIGVYAGSTTPNLKSISKAANTAVTNIKLKNFLKAVISFSGQNSY
jgi:hypothetical protein